MLRYVFSAPGMFRLKKYPWEDEYPEKANKYKMIITECIKKICDDVKNINEDITLGIDILYNAYTESDLGPRLQENENFGFGKIYADSGGLQIVTAKKSIDTLLKSKIYKDQNYADYAMCFDEIPVKNVEGITVSPSINRIITTNKKYYPELAYQSAIKTASNIREQIEVFDNMESKTKVFYIVQGNSYDDMVNWFRNGSKVLDKQHFDRICGISLSFACIGKGELESVDTLIAYHLIREEFGKDLTKNHIHFLGLGGIIRLVPVLYFIKSGLLPKELTISFDSSSLSIAYILGRFMDSDGNSINPGDEVGYIKMFNKFFDYFDEIFEKYYPNYDKERLILHLVENIRSASNTISRIKSIDGKYEYFILINVTLILIIIWQIIGYSKKIKEIMDYSSFDNSPIGLLQYVKNFDDYKSWYRENHYRVGSKRIKRNQNNTVDNWFE